MIRHMAGHAILTVLALSAACAKDPVGLRRAEATTTLSADATASASRSGGDDDRDNPTLKAKILPVVAGLLFPNALNELVGMTTAVTQSDLDWTIARITRPTGGRPKGTVRAGFLGRDKVGSVMSRADIAAFLVAQLTDETFLRAAPAISN